jgi:hypothetical protein
MAAKRIGKCLSAPITSRMAFASRCEIQGRASRRQLSSACSKLSTARNRAVWDLGCRSAGRLLKRITDDCGRPLICHVALSSGSPRLLIRGPHRDWSLASTSTSCSSLRMLRSPSLSFGAAADDSDRARDSSHISSSVRIGVIADLDRTLNLPPTGPSKRTYGRKNCSTVSLGTTNCVADTGLESNLEKIDRLS